MNADPLVTVVIATYNWSSVLRHAIQSVLWQTFQDWELLVIGDACTDDSEQVAASFGDPRIQWHNLPENTGSQAGPNNKGITLARGRYIAYLGHDDLWYFDHLELLTGAMQETSCDLAFTITEALPPPPQSMAYLWGLSPTGTYDYGVVAPPSSWMHRTSLAQETGFWRDPRSIRAPLDVDFLFRVHEAGKHIHIVHALTVFKFPASMRKGSYTERPSHEQADYAQRIRHDPNLRYHELMRIVSHPWYVERLFKREYRLADKSGHGAMGEYARELRGLPLLKPQDGPAPEPEAPLPLNVSLLKLLNHREDIGPLADRIRLFTASELPADGLFIGTGWYHIEQDAWGQFYRWAPDGVEIVLSRLTGQRRYLAMDVAPGPGVGYAPFKLEVLNEAGTVVACVSVGGRGMIEIELPVQAGDGHVFRLRAVDGGRLIETDARIMNFAVYRLGWVEPTTLQARKDQADLYAMRAEYEVLKRTNAETRHTLETTETALAKSHEELQQINGAMAQLLRFRQSSLRYWLLRVRTSPKLRRLLRLPE